MGNSALISKLGISPLHFLICVLWNRKGVVVLYELLGQGRTITQDVFFYQQLDRIKETIRQKCPTLVFFNIKRQGNNSKNNLKQIRLLGHVHHSYSPDLVRTGLHALITRIFIKKRRIQNRKKS